MFIALIYLFKILKVKFNDCNKDALKAEFLIDRCEEQNMLKIWNLQCFKLPLVKKMYKKAHNGLIDNLKLSSLKAILY